MTDFLQWQSTLSAEQVFSSSASINYPCADSSHPSSSGFIYLTQMLEQGSRNVIKRVSADGEQCLTPEPFDLRTKISEYGGKPFWLHGANLYFANHRDQCLYRQTLDQQGASAPQRVSAQAEYASKMMFSDVVELNPNALLAIAEVCTDSSESASTQSKHCIVLLDLDEADTPAKVLVEGADFYSNLVYHPATQRLAWVEWDHPNMPWDENRVVVASIEQTVTHAASLDISPLKGMPQTSSACQLRFAPNGRLFYVADIADGASPAEDFWNLYCYDFATLHHHQVTKEQRELGYPHWQYGDSRLEQFDSQHMLAISSAPSGDALVLVNQQTLEIVSRCDDGGSLQNLAGTGDGRALCVRNGVRTGQQVVSVSGLALQRSVELPSTSSFADVSIAQHISFAVDGDVYSHGFYYPPQNSQYSEQFEHSQAKPPLIVLVHGGPTARAYGHLDLQKQFWTSRGFALLDVNHRGSSGYGRAYRDALYGEWGEFDCADIIAGVSSLIRQGKVDPERICIRGKSAGGYAVLRALTEHPDVFKAGACYYGIGNLATLAQVTHKFEKYYTDRLIGETFDSAKADKTSSKFYQRSPIYKLNKLDSAMIVFQGLQDKVVPPSVAREIINVLRLADKPHRYVEYADEAHGFRQLANNVDALNLELDFYRSVLA